MTRFRSNLSRCKNIQAKTREQAFKKSTWTSNSKYGDEIGVGGQKLKLSNIGIDLHVEFTSSKMEAMFRPSGLFTSMLFLIKMALLLCFS